MRFWQRNQRSSNSDEFEYVYVNQDGSVRELSPKEKEYLNEKFDPCDGARPYIKSRYKSHDGWGSISGFLPREKVPANLAIEPVNPQYDSLRPKASIETTLEDHRLVGDIIKTNPNGSISCIPNPNLSKEFRFEMLRLARLDRQRKEEALGKYKR